MNGLFLRNSKRVVSTVLGRNEPIFTSKLISLRMASTEYKNIIVSTKGEKSNVGLIQLNRPKALNALNTPLMEELIAALKSFQADDSIGCCIITGNEKAFAAGADITEMSSLSFQTHYKTNYLGDWSDITKIAKPIIAAVDGHALGEQM